MSFGVTMLRQIKCAITKHTVPDESEASLFKQGTIKVKTECEKCQTPLELTREKDHTDFYYMTELIEEEPDNQ